MFCTDLREKHEQCVNIKGIDAEDMKTLLDYTYTSKVHITKDNVQKTLEAASLFQVCDYHSGGSIITQCVKLLCKCVYVYNSVLSF